jgi:DDE_Tnp_1-associated
VARRGGSEDITPERCSDLVTHLAGLPDPRDRRGLRYGLASVLAVAVCAVLAGAKSLAAIGEWAKVTVGLLTPRCDGDPVV